jgi:hypothetical protein
LKNKKPSFSSLLNSLKAGWVTRPTLRWLSPGTLVKLEISPRTGNHRPNLKLNHQCSYLQVRSSTWRLLSKYCLVWWPQDRQNLQFCQSWKNCLVGPVPSRGSLTRRRRYHLRQLPQSRYPGAATVLGFISTRTVQNSGGIRETTRGPRPQRNPAVAPWAPWRTSNKRRKPWRRESSTRFHQHRGKGSRCPD